MEKIHQMGQAIYVNEYFLIFPTISKFPVAKILLGTTPQSSTSTHHIFISQWIATMDFENSSQARSWLFDNGTLMQCRQKALTERPKGSSSLDRVRRFASGYHRRHADTAENFDPPHTNRQVSLESLTAEEQEMLVRFHAKQITQLIGPTAVLNGLVRNSAILATAIMLFRRFYLSNSVLDCEPRRIAVAAAYLASKVEEQRVEVRHIMVDGELCFSSTNRLLCSYSCLKKNILFSISGLCILVFIMWTWNIQ
jgi:hypothetical protein